MPTETTAATTTATPVASSAAPAKPPASATPPTSTATPAPESAEAASLKAEALKSARELREAREKLQRYERAEKERADRDRMTAKEREEEQKLLETDPHAWIEKRAGMSRAELQARLTTGKPTPETATQRRLDELAAENAAIKKSLEEREAAAERAQTEAAHRTAYTSVLAVAKGGESDPELRLAHRRLAEMGPAAGREIALWAEKEWPKYAAEKGLPPGDVNEAAKVAAKVIGAKALAELKGILQDEHIRAALMPSAQSQQPAASQGAPARTITGTLAGTRGPSAPDKPRSKSELEAELRANAERAVRERLAARG
jgi:hypothetical protein